MKLAFSAFSIILGLGLLFFVFLNRQKEEQVLGLISPEVVVTPEISPTEEATLSAAIWSTPSALPIASSSATPKPTATPQPQPEADQPLAGTPSIAPATSSEINSFIDRFSTQYGIDPNIVRHIALCESGFKSDAQNLVYAGLFQFDANTWINYRRQMGEETAPELRFSAEEAVQTAAFVLSIGKGKIWPNCLP